ncbi:hypothetical protein NDU88_001029 [Pleurodeles waltl]|uniref:Uncharacterized protein n=1 Tax=Pleurodeles waltl TaxID=8319 RepID=A0AAV7WLA4_PLEWA|nr:hypothetical protein NDU88_001029 [Pleurodeles waltl]
MRTEARGLLEPLTLHRAHTWEKQACKSLLLLTALCDTGSYRGHGHRQRLSRQKRAAMELDSISGELTCERHACWPRCHCTLSARCARWTRRAQEACSHEHTSHSAAIRREGEGSSLPLETPPQKGTDTPAGLRAAETVAPSSAPRISSERS